MRLISWNVNGIRSCLSKGFLDFFQTIDADIFCLQEIKAEQAQVELNIPGYTQYWNSAQKKGYSGTAVFTRLQPLSHQMGMNIVEHDQEGRIITLEFSNFYLVNVYTPNSKSDLARLTYRMKWDDDFRLYVKALENKKPVIVCGDLNVAHQEIDLKNPKTNRRSAGFTDEERAKMTLLLGSGFADSFRHFYPDQTQAYTWWSYFRNARQNNAGWRIDYFVVSDGLKPNLQEASIYADTMGSDHCPVGIDLSF